MHLQPGRPQWVRREVIEPGRTSPLRAMAASSSAMRLASRRWRGSGPWHSFAEGIPHHGASVLYIYSSMTGPSAAEVIGRWAPRSVPPEVVAFARRVVTRAEPKSAARAKALLFAAGKLGAFAASVGLPLDEEVLLRAALIERFVSSRFAGTPPTACTLRTNLRNLARFRPLRRGAGAHRPAARRAKAPYSAAELAAYLALADAQPTSLRRERADALICLGAGAGLIGGELRSVRGTDAVCRSGRRAVRVARAQTTCGAGARGLPRAPARRGRLLRRALIWSAGRTRRPTT